MTRRQTSHGAQRQGHARRGRKGARGGAIIGADWVVATERRTGRVARRARSCAPLRGRGSDDGDNERTGRLGLALAVPCVLGARRSAGVVAAAAPALQGAPPGYDRGTCRAP